MREITTHKVNGLNEALRITVRDDPGPGGACHRYHITTVEIPPPVGGGMSHADLEKAQSMLKAVHDINFQNGPIAVAGVNGISNEALLAIVRDRLEGFQKGPYACDETANALGCVVNAMDQLSTRTKDRIARGVEGKLQK